jgi:gamma-glutamyl phosphate reductase
VGQQQRFSTDNHFQMNAVLQLSFTRLTTMACGDVQDVAEAEGQVSPALLQRLILKPQKIQQLADGIRAIAAQEEPIRRVLQRTEVADGERATQRNRQAAGQVGVYHTQHSSAVPPAYSLSCNSTSVHMRKGYARISACQHLCWLLYCVCCCRAGAGEADSTHWGAADHL